MAFFPPLFHHFTSTITRHVFGNHNFNRLQIIVFYFTFDYITINMPSYMPEALNHAINAVQNGTSLRKASKDWGVPYSTIQSRLLVVQSHQKTSPQSRVSFSPINSCLR